MSVVKYRRDSGSWTPIIDKKVALAPVVFTVMPDNAKVGGKLSVKNANKSKNLVMKNNLGQNAFTFNMKVKALQTQDPNVQVENFWYLPMVSVWATKVDVMTGYWIESHVTWHRTKTIGKTTSNAPQIAGEIAIKITNPMNQVTNFGHPITYFPFTNQITI